jgi:hypothetical protein
VQELTRRSDGFSGAEIEEAVISGLFDAFSGQLEISNEILGSAIVETVPFRGR